MDTKKLRQKILDLAIRGKLVPQDPNDEPASVLLERIRAEKEQLIKEGKIKRSKKSAASDTSHYENYELPQGWAYATMSDICTKIVDGDHNPPIAQKAESEYIMISSKNVVNDSIIHLDDVRHLSRADFELSNARTQVSKGDVLFTSVASLGRTCIYDLDYPITFQRSVTVICTKIFNRYLKLFLDSPLYQNYVVENARGTAQKGFYINQISDSWVPIPPLNEQIRIVEKAQSLLDIVQIINYSKEETSNNIIALKSKILDLAISGKLVRQDKSDEPAIELLKRINPQYQHAYNRHYENVPKGWCFAKIKDIFIINPKNKANDYDMAGFVSMSMINEGYVDSYQYETREWSSIKAGFTHFQDGDIAVAKISPCLENRKSMILKGLPNGIGAGTTELHVFRSSIVDARYALYFFKSDYFIAQCIGTFNGVVGQQRVGKSVIEDIVFPLPPLEEQRRIACTISVIFKHLDNILSEL